jgi:hypothetical protein
LPVVVNTISSNSKTPPPPPQQFPKLKQINYTRNHPKIKILSIPGGGDGGENDLALGLPVGRHGGGSPGVPPHTAKLYSSEHVNSLLNTHKCVNLLCAGISQEYRSGRRTKEKRKKVSTLFLSEIFVGSVFVRCPQSPWTN